MIVFWFLSYFFKIQKAWLKKKIKITFNKAAEANWTVNFLGLTME